MIPAVVLVLSAVLWSCGRLEIHHVFGLAGVAWLTWIQAVKTVKIKMMSFDPNIDVLAMAVHRAHYGIVTEIKRTNPGVCILFDPPKEWKDVPQGFQLKFIELANLYIEAMKQETIQ